MLVWGLLILLSLQAQSKPCEMWTKTCADLQKFREAKAKAWASGEECLACGFSEPDPFKNLADLSATKAFDRSKFFNCLESNRQTVSSLIEHDAKVIEDEMKRLEINSVSLDEIDALLNDASKPLARARDKLEKVTGFNRAYAKNASTGPIQSLTESYTGYRIHDYQSGGIRKHDVSGREEILAAGKDVLSFLVKRMYEHSGNSAQFLSRYSYNRQAVTGAMAKALLYEVLRDRLSAEKQVALLKRLKLKFNVQDPFSDTIRDPDFVTLHNGFFLGAREANFPAKSKRVASMAFDCTSAIQTCLSKAGVGFSPDFKLLTSRLAYLKKPEGDLFQDAKNYEVYFDTQDYQCEEQLEPGDIIVSAGHAMVFAGYEKDRKGQWQMMTYEAAGDETREFGKFSKDIYFRGDCENVYFQNGRIVRVKK